MKHRTIPTKTIGFLLQRSPLKRKWITLVSRGDKRYGVGIHLTKLIEHGRPKDPDGKPMVAKKPEIEKLLKEVGIK